MSYLFFFGAEGGLRYTGGTIGMLKGPDGSLRPEPGALRQRLQKLEELNQVQRCLLRGEG